MKFVLLLDSGFAWGSSKLTYCSLFARMKYYCVCELLLEVCEHLLVMQASLVQLIWCLMSYNSYRVVMLVRYGTGADLRVEGCRCRLLVDEV